MMIPFPAREYVKAHFQAGNGKFHRKGESLAIKGRANIQLAEKI
jgi:hypothetical protein